MAGFTKDLFKKGLSWLGSKLGIVVKDFAPAVSHDAEVAAEAKAREAIQKAAKPTTALGSPATPPPAVTPVSAVSRPPQLANRTEALQAMQTIKEMAGGLRTDPSRANEVVRQSLNVFSSPAAAGHVGEVTRTLASTISQAGPSTAARLTHALRDGHRALEEQIVQRSVKGLEPGANKLQVCHGNLGDAATLLETGAVGKSREVALTAVVRNLGDLEKAAPGSGVQALARLAKTPQLMREIEDFATRNGGSRQVFSAESVLAAAKANGADAGKNAEWRDVLTRTLDRQFAGNPRAELEWLTQHKGEVSGGISANVLVHRALAAAQKLPVSTTSPAHDAVVEVVRGVKLTPDLDKQVAKFWLDSNIALRKAGHESVADNSAMKAVGAAQPSSQMSRVAETEFKVGHIATPSSKKPTAAEEPPPSAAAASSAPPPPASSASPAAETVDIPAVWGSLSSSAQNSFNFGKFEARKAAERSAPAVPADPRASLLSDSLHPTPVRSPRPD